MADFHFALKKNVSGVHAGVNAHGGEARTKFSIRNCPVDRSSAAVFGKQRSVEIDPAMFGNRKKPRGNNLAVGNDDDYFGGEFFQKFLKFGSANFLRLVYRNISAKRDALHGRNGNLLTTATRSVRLRNDREHLEIRFSEQMLQRGNSKLRRTTEN